MIQIQTMHRKKLNNVRNRIYSYNIVDHSRLVCPLEYQRLSLYIKPDLTTQIRFEVENEFQCFKLSSTGESLKFSRLIKISPSCIFDTVDYLLVYHTVLAEFFDAFHNSEVTMKHFQWPTSLKDICHENHTDLFREI